MAIGSNAGQYLTTGTNNTFLGYNAGIGSGLNYSYSTAIGSNATLTSDHQIVLGGSNSGVHPEVYCYNRLYAPSFQVTSSTGIIFENGSTLTTGLVGKLQLLITGPGHRILQIM